MSPATGLDVKKGRLLIVDQSLSDLNGHHFEYDVALANAAASRGIDTLIAANRDFSIPVDPDSHPIAPHFANAWNEGHRGPLTRASLLTLRLLPQKLRSALFAGRARLMARFHGNTGARLSVAASSFGDELVALMKHEAIASDDHVLIHTLGLAELHAMIERLAGRNLLPTIHLVLRRDADEPDLHDGAPGGGMRGALANLACQPCLAQRVRLYCDTEQLAHQHRPLASGLSIGVVPIPHALPEVDRSTLYRTGSACVTYLGNARNEKGFHHIAEAVHVLNASHIRTGLLRFVLQANSNLSLEEPVIARARNRLKSFPTEHVELITHPPGIHEFQRRLREADIILLPYDTDAYRRRSSGILVQALVSGRPVIVPRGTWLSEVAPDDAAVIFDNPADLPAALAEATERRAELCQAALAHAAAWGRAHNPDAMLAQILECAPSQDQRISA